MPVTKTAKRALRSSLRKEAVNKVIVSKLEIALRNAKKSKKAADVQKAVSLADIAAKKHVLHKNKAARIKSSLSKLLAKEPKQSAKKPAFKKSSGKK